MQADDETRPKDGAADDAPPPIVGRDEGPWSTALALLALALIGLMLLHACMKPMSVAPASPPASTTPQR
jgi:hypothetical protein